MHSIGIIILKVIVFLLASGFVFLVGCACFDEQTSKYGLFPTRGMKIMDFFRRNFSSSYKKRELKFMELIQVYKPLIFEQFIEYEKVFRENEKINYHQRIPQYRLDMEDKAWKKSWELTHEVHTKLINAGFNRKYARIKYPNELNDGFQGFTFGEMYTGVPVLALSRGIKFWNTLEEELNKRQTSAN